MTSIQIIVGDARTELRKLDAGSINMCCTSPPYWGLRDYGHDGQIGLEATPAEYVEALVGVFREVRRVLRDDGTLWLNLGDSYSEHGAGSYGKEADYGAHTGRVARRGIGLPPKNLVGIPWRVAFALQADGWFLRSDCIWHKPNPMPESVTDRPTKSHEYVFLLSKSERYYYNADAVREPDSGRRAGNGFAGRQGGSARVGPQEGGAGTVEPRQPGWGRNRRTVWSIATQPFKGAHFATMPPALVEPCVLAGCPRGGTVLDPFGGAGTVGLVAQRLQRSALLVELNPEYADIARERIRGDAPLLSGVA